MWLGQLSDCADTGEQLSTDWDRMTDSLTSMQSMAVFSSSTITASLFLPNTTDTASSYFFNDGLHRSLTRPLTPGKILCRLAKVSRNLASRSDSLRFTPASSKSLYIWVSFSSASCSSLLQKNVSRRLITKETGSRYSRALRLLVLELLLYIVQLLLQFFHPSRQLNEAAKYVMKWD